MGVQKEKDKFEFTRYSKEYKTAKLMPQVVIISYR
jgi:hypothetical protein